MGISESCLHEMEMEVMPQFDFESLGVPLKIYNSAVKSVCKLCKQITVEVPYLEKLAAAAAMYRCKLPERLLGQEIKFLRKSLAWTGATLAEKLKVAPETVSRWENDKAPIPPISDQLFRVQVFSALKEKAPAIDISVDEIVNVQIKGVRPETIAPMKFALVLFKEEKRELTEEYGEPLRAAA